jgi:hypothetical protein
MRYMYRMIAILLPVLTLSLTGCGSSSNGSTADPFSSDNQGTNTTPTPTGSGKVLSYTMSLSTTSTSGDSNVGPNGTVNATATLKDNSGNLISNQPIKFEEIVLPGTTTSVTISVPIVSTSSDGTATSFLQAINTETTRDVVIKASTSINGQLISSISTFKIVRSTGNYINFITTKNTTDPDGNLNTLKVTIDNIDPTLVPSHSILQLVPFEVLDRDGVPRTLVPVKLSIYSVLGGCTVFTDSPESGTERTVTTDNKGLGVFNSFVNISTPPIGSENSCAVIYKATAPDPYSTVPTDLFSYGAYIVTLKNIKNVVPQ